MLRTMLDHQQKVHEIMARVQRRNDHHSALSIPNFLPPKVKTCSLILYIDTFYSTLSRCSVIDLFNIYFDVLGLQEIAKNMLLDG